MSDDLESVKDFSRDLAGKAIERLKRDPANRHKAREFEDIRLAVEYLCEKLDELEPDARIERQQAIWRSLKESWGQP